MKNTLDGLFTSLGTYRVGFLDRNGVETPGSDPAGRSGIRSWQRQGHWGGCARATSVAALVLLATSAGAEAGPTPCRLLVPFDPDNFSDPTRITNAYLPRSPGTEWILEKEDGGRIVTRATAMTKTFKFDDEEVKARVVWELDLDDVGEVEEEELRFEAQDNFGNVWNFGELPLEEDDEGNLTFENTWIAGFGGAMAGHAMLAHPEDKPAQTYLQAFAPDVIGDCAKVTAVDVPVEIELEEPSMVLQCDSVLIRESSTAFDGEGGVQLKNYCRAVEEVGFFGGLVHIGGQGGADGQEMARLISDRQAECNEIVKWRKAVLDLEKLAYEGGDPDPESPEPYLPPNVLRCDSDDPDASCPNHEPVEGPRGCS